MDRYIHREHPEGEAGTHAHGFMKARDIARGPYDAL